MDEINLTLITPLTLLSLKKRKQIIKKRKQIKEKITQPFCQKFIEEFTFPCFPEPPLSLQFLSNDAAILTVPPSLRRKLPAYVAEIMPALSLAQRGSPQWPALSLSVSVLPRLSHQLSLSLPPSILGTQSLPSSKPCRRP